MNPTTISTNAVVVLLLTAAVLASALALVYTKHQSRKLHIELQSLGQQAQDYEIEWELLQLEQSTLASEFVVDRLARSRLGMFVPDPDSVVYITR